MHPSSARWGGGGPHDNTLATINIFFPVRCYKMSQSRLQTTRSGYTRNPDAPVNHGAEKRAELFSCRCQKFLGKPTPTLKDHLEGVARLFPPVIIFYDFFSLSSHNRSRDKTTRRLDIHACTRPSRTHPAVTRISNLLLRSAVQNHQARPDAPAAACRRGTMPFTPV